MRKRRNLAALVFMLVAAAFTAPMTAAAEQVCWYEGMTWDHCNGQMCPGGWCCYICTR